MKKLLNKKTFALVFILLLGVVFLWHHYSSSSHVPEAKTIWVKVGKPKEMNLALDAKAIGTIVARSVEISPEISGHVHKILFKDGRFVQKGDLLMQLDDAVYRAKYRSAVAQFTYSDNNYRRMSLLAKKGIVAKQAIDQADADLKEKRANVQENEVMVNKMKLVAPFDGMVGKTKVHRGDYVTTGQSVVTLTDTKHLHVEYNIPEKYLPLLKIGQEVKITSAAYPKRIFTGKVAYISPTINAENRSVSLYAGVPNNENLLAAGMLVEVTHSLGTESKVLMVPARSLVPALEGEQIYTVVDGKAYAVTVTTGKRTEENVQIIRGLKPSATIITDGQHKVRNGTPVKIKT